MAHEASDHNPTLPEVLAAMDPLERVMWERVVDRATIRKQNDAIAALETALHHVLEEHNGVSDADDQRAGVAGASPSKSGGASAL